MTKSKIPYYVEDDFSDYYSYYKNHKLEHFARSIIHKFQSISEAKTIMALSKKSGKYRKKQLGFIIDNYYRLSFSEWICFLKIPYNLLLNQKRYDIKAFVSLYCQSPKLAKQIDYNNLIKFRDNILTCDIKFLNEKYDIMENKNNNNIKKKIDLKKTIKYKCYTIEPIEYNKDFFNIGLKLICCYTMHTGHWAQVISDSGYYFKIKYNNEVIGVLKYYVKKDQIYGFGKDFCNYSKECITAIMKLIRKNTNLSLTNTEIINHGPGPQVYTHL